MIRPLRPSAVHDSFARGSALLAIAAACVLGLGGCDSTTRQSNAAPVGGSAIPSGPVDTQGFTRTLAPAGGSSQTSQAIVDRGFVPPLPADVGLQTTQTGLGVQALLAARAEIADGQITGETIDQRHLAIYQAWLPEMAARQARLQKIADRRKAQTDAAIAQGAHDGVLTHQYREQDERTERELERNGLRGEPRDGADATR